MVLFYKYFFVFSLRLGAIIIGTLTLAKSSVWLILQFWSLECLADFSNFLEKLLTQEPILAHIANYIQLYDNLEYYLIGLAVFYSLQILVCIILLKGAYQCKVYFIYPFLYGYVVYVFLVFVDMALLYQLIINENNGLHVIIMYLSSCVFGLAFCIYNWCCIYSLTQVINILQDQVAREIKSASLHLTQPKRGGAETTGSRHTAQLAK